MQNEKCTFQEMYTQRVMRIFHQRALLRVSPRETHKGNPEVVCIYLCVSVQGSSFSLLTFNKGVTVT